MHRGSAYTFPKDDGANAWNQCNSGVIDCCVGTSCPAPARQPKSKRELNDVESRHVVSHFSRYLLKIEILTWRIDSMALKRPIDRVLLRFGNGILSQQDPLNLQWELDGELFQQNSLRARQFDSVVWKR